MSRRDHRGERTYYYRPSEGLRHGGGKRGAQHSATFRVSRVKGFLIISALLLIAVFIAVVLLNLFTSYFDLKYIKVEGLLGNSEEEITEASGIKLGEKLYSLNASEAEKAILSEYPYLLRAKVKRKLPDTAVIELTYDTPMYFTEVTGEYFTLSENMRVLDRSSDRRGLEAEGLLHLILPTVKKAITGERIEFFDDCEEYISELLEAFRNSEFADDVNRIYASSKFDISLVKSGAYRIELGEAKELSLKMKMASKILDEGSYRETSGVIVDIRNVSEGSVRVDKNADLG